MASTVPWGEGAIAESRVLQQLPLAVFIMAEDRILDVNDAACRLLGYDDREGLVGRDFSALRKPSQPLVEIQGDRTSLQSMQESLVRADGGSVVVDVVKIPLRFDEKEASLLVALEAARSSAIRTQFIHAHGLETVGALAAGVAHEINNPLTYLMMGLERVVSAVSGTPVERHARIAQEGAERIRSMVMDLQAFGRGDGDRPQPLNVEAVLERVLTVTSLGIQYRAPVIRDFAGVEPVLGHEARLGQLFSSMLLDAAHSFDPRREAETAIRITTRSEEEHVTVTISSGADYSSSVRLPISRVADSGMRRRPYSLAPSATKIEGRPRVLVVDDDPLVRDVIAERLEPFAEVELARSGDEAIDRLSSGEYHAVLADLMMPDVTGMDLYDWIATRRPTMRDRVVFMTGGAFTAKAREFLASIDNPLVEKPVVEAELLAALVRVLGRARRTTAQTRSA